MKQYRFYTDAAMKEYNCKKWWIDRGIVRPMVISAENVRSALEIYRERVLEEYYISISANAIKNKSAMYRDRKDGTSYQCGYVITGKTEFEDRDNYKWSTQYIDLWVEITEVLSVDFEEVA